MTCLGRTATVGALALVLAACGGEKQEAEVNAFPPLAGSEIATTLTYVRWSWGNAAPPVTAAEVAAVRAATAGRTTPWTWEELQAAKLD